MVTADDHSTPAALSHDTPCHGCGHAPHILACSATCSCSEGAVALGIDTALGG